MSIDMTFDPSCPVHHVHPELSPELQSITSLVPAAETNAPARCVMFGSHFASRPVIEGSEPSLTQTGVEEELGKYTFKVKMPKDGRIEQIINRYNIGITDQDTDATFFNPETLVIYRVASTGQYDCFTVPYYCSHDPVFGFKYETKPILNNLAPGQDIPAGTVFADSPAVKGESHYSSAVNLNIIVMSHKNVGLDGFVVSRDVLDKFKFRVYERRTIEFGSDSFLLNTYGNKAFPDIGEDIREDGLLAVIRKINLMDAPSSFSINDIKRKDYIFDTPVFARPGKGKVVDIQVVQSVNNNKVLSPELVTQAAKYAKKTRRYYQELVNFHNRVVQEEKRKNKGLDVNPYIFSPKLSSLIVTAMAVTNQKTIYPQPLTITYKNRPIDTWRLEFTIEYEITPTRGFKATCQNGGIQ